MFGFLALVVSCHGPSEWNAFKTLVTIGAGGLFAFNLSSVFEALLNYDLVQALETSQFYEWLRCEVLVTMACIAGSCLYLLLRSCFTDKLVLCQANRLEEN